MLDVAPANLGDSVLRVAASFEHTCALMQDGSLRCWGDDSEDQLGYVGDLECLNCPEDAPVRCVGDEPWGMPPPPVPFM